MAVPLPTHNSPQDQQCEFPAALSHSWRKHSIPGAYSSRFNWFSKFRDEFRGGVREMECYSTDMTRSCQHDLISCGPPRQHMENVFISRFLAVGKKDRVAAVSGGLAEFDTIDKFHQMAFNYCLISRVASSRVRLPGNRESGGSKPVPSSFRVLV